MPRKFYKIEVGLTGLDEVTTEFEQDVFYGSEAVAIVSVIWKGILASKRERAFLKVRGCNSILSFSCTANQNPSLDDLKLPEPFVEDEK